MERRNQDKIRHIAQSLRCLLPIPDVDEAVFRRSFRLAREAVEGITGQRQSDADHERMVARAMRPPGS